VRKQAESEEAGELELFRLKKQRWKKHNKARYAKGCCKDKRTICCPRGLHCIKNVSEPPPFLS